MSTLVWFRRDLRLRDNPALNAAFEHDDPVIPVYIHSPSEEKPWSPGAASRWYLHHSLSALAHSLSDYNLELNTSTGSSAKQLIMLAKKLGAKRVHWNKIYEPLLIERDDQVENALKMAGLEVKRFHDHSLFPPGTVRNQSDELYRVFTPFWRRLASVIEETNGAQGTCEINLAKRKSSNSYQSQINALKLLDDHPWHQKLKTYWHAGEESAWALLTDFLDRLPEYKKWRDFPAKNATSKLSAALHFGEMSPWRIMHALQPAYQGEHGKEAALNAESIMRQVGWREFAINLLHMAPDSPDYSLQEKFEDSGIWFHDPNFIEQWQRGNTGFPLVDAGMSELWETGWMHNRVRMVVASMLTKNLGQHWIHGARWFWDTLVDADLANNTMGWQWVAGSGCDAAPYYRIFNPETQAKRFDPDGKYISHWLDSANLKTPIVDLASSREEALARYARVPK